MRIFLVFTLLVSFLFSRGQTVFQPAMLNYSPMGISPYNPLLNSKSPDKKWSFNTYAGISTGLIFSNRGSSSFLAAPMGLQVNRRLNNNLYAIGGVSVAPTYQNFNRSFLNTNLRQTPLGPHAINTQGFGLSSRMEAGLMYINDQRTFSIGGSIIVERRDFPSYPAYNQNNPKIQPVNGPK
jgi:hypothetical protein